MTVAGIASVAALGAFGAYGRSGGARTHARASSADAPTAPTFGYEIVRSYPHDPGAATQGLIYRDGFLYESTGAQTSPSLRKVQLETGAVVHQRPVAEPHVGEGLTEWSGALVHLTPVRSQARGSAALKKMSHLDYLMASIGRRLRMNFGTTCDPESLTVRSTFTYTGEGWGLTHDDRRLILSDGTSELRFLDPQTFAARGSVRVTDGGRPIALLNELEFVNGQVYANVWFEDRIAMIAADSGRVAGWIDLAGLVSSLEPRPDRDAGDVLNGIAFDRAHGRLFVTGKRWPRVFEIRVRPIVPAS